MRKYDQFLTKISSTGNKGNANANIIQKWTFFIHLNDRIYTRTSP